MTKQETAEETVEKKLKRRTRKLWWDNEPANFESLLTTVTEKTTVSENNQELEEAVHILLTSSGVVQENQKIVIKDDACAKNLYHHLYAYYQNLVWNTNEQPYMLDTLMLREEIGTETRDLVNLLELAIQGRRRESIFEEITAERSLYKLVNYLENIENHRPEETRHLGDNLHDAVEKHLRKEAERYSKTNHFKLLNQTGNLNSTDLDYTVSVVLGARTEYIFNEDVNHVDLEAMSVLQTPKNAENRDILSILPQNLVNKHNRKIRETPSLQGKQSTLEELPLKILKNPALYTTALQLYSERPRQPDGKNSFEHYRKLAEKLEETQDTNSY